MISGIAFNKSYPRSITRPPDGQFCPTGPDWARTDLCFQPGPGTVRLDDVQDARIAGSETCEAVAQPIPSTSIME
jgi:hypothetical protein